MGDSSYRKNIFARNIYVARTTLQRTQKEVAEFLHISRSAYSYYEIGKTEPSLDCLCGLSHYFDVSIDELLGVGSGCKKERKKRV